ncbi:OprO/OprP family phosphate-selective porin [Planctomycetota bacterium]
MPILRKAAFAVLLLAVPLSVTAFAQDEPDPLESLEKEFAELKKEINELRTREEESAKTGARKRPSVDDQGLGFAELWGYDVAGTWKDGFELNFLDPYEEEAELQPIHRMGLHGRLDFDYRLYADEKHPTDDTFFINRARLESKGFFYRHIEYHLEGEFAQDGGTELKNANLNVACVKGFQTKFGHQKTPFGVEWAVNGRYLNFLERPMAFQVMGIDYDLGAVAHGNLTYANYQLGVFNGSGSNTADETDDKDVAARLQLTPFRNELDSPLRDMALGGSFSTGHRRGFSPAFTTQGGTPWLIPAVGPGGRPTVTDQRGQVSRAGGNLLVAGGPLRIQAEYLFMRVADVNLGKNQFDLGIHGLYVDVLLMVTLERRFLDERVIPEENFDPSEGTWGAWELGARYEHLDVESDFARKSTKGTDVVDSFTVGLNWYLTPYVKFSGNYQRVMFDDRIRGVAFDQKDEDVVFFRLGLEF